MLNFGNLGGTICSEGIPICKFKYLRGEVDELATLNLTTNPLPFEFIGRQKISSFDLYNFFDARITPETRIGLDKEMAEVGLAYYDPEALIRISGGKCIHDCYTVECDKDESWMQRHPDFTWEKWEAYCNKYE